VTAATTTEVFEQARSLAFRGDARGALARVDELLAREPAHVPGLLLKGTVLLELREGEEATMVFERATGLAPRSAEAWNGLARCRHALGDDQGGLRDAELARTLLGEGDNFRQRAAVYLTIVWCLREMRRYREALEAAEEGLSGMPDAVLAQWASVVEEEYAESQKEEC
jgi:cytochrome c-type biogenesis protein CcmH/NrfG